MGTARVNAMAVAVQTQGVSARPVGVELDVCVIGAPAGRRRMRLSRVLETVEGEVISKNVDMNQEVQAGCGADLMSATMASSREHALLISGLTAPQVVRTAEMADVRAIVFVRGKLPWPETIALSEKMGIPLQASNYTMFEACGRLYQAGLPSCGAVDPALPRRRETSEHERASVA